MYYLPRLKEVRLLKNMKQKDVCEKLNMKQSQYSRYESGEDEMKIGTLIEICEALDISADYILRLSDIPKALDSDNNGKQKQPPLNRNSTAVAIFTLPVDAPRRKVPLVCAHTCGATALFLAELKVIRVAKPP